MVHLIYLQFNGTEHRQKYNRNTTATTMTHCRVRIIGLVPKKCQCIKYLWPDQDKHKRTIAIAARRNHHPQFSPPAQRFSLRSNCQLTLKAGR